MSDFFELPADLTSSLLFNWLILKDLVKLDTAICQKSRRSQFLPLISSEHLVYTRWIKHKNEDVLMLKWLVTRKFHISHIRWCASCESSLLEYFFGLTGKCIVAMSVEHMRKDYNENTFEAIARHCSNIRELCVAVIDEYELQSIASSCRQIGGAGRSRSWSFQTTPHWNAVRCFP